MPRRPKQPLTGHLAEALAAVDRALSTLPSGGMIISGIAVILHGVPRVTRDIDATVDASSIELGDLLRHFVAHDIAPRIDDALEFAKTSQVLLLRHDASSIDVDLSLAWISFELEALAQRERVERGRIKATVARPEDLIIYKAVAWRPQDRQDIERLLTLYADRMDMSRVRTIVAELADALDEPTRAVELEALISDALGRR